VSFEDEALKAALDRARGDRARSRWRWSIPTAACAVLVWICLMCAPAFGLDGRGHVFVSAFGGEGSYAFADAQGIAVDDATGDVYVVDAAHERVVRLAPTPSGEYEPAGELKVPSPGAIAVDDSTNEADPSKGDVYVAGGEERGLPAEDRDFIYKFNPTGERVFRRSIFKVRKHGEEFEAELEDIAGIAVDGEGQLWTYSHEEGVINGFTDERSNKLVPGLTKELPLEELYECPTAQGFAVAPGDEAFYVGHVRESPLGECPEEGAAAQEIVAKTNAAGEFVAKSLDTQDTTGVAVDPADGTVFADNQTSIAAFAASGAFVQRFGAGNLTDGAALAVDGATGEVFAIESGGERVAVFAAEGVRAPEIDGVETQSLTPTSERVTAEIDPHGADTHYYVEYGSQSCTAEPAACVDVPVSPGADAGAGFGDVAESVELTGLQPNSTYFYRVRAESSEGVAESSEAARTFFTTLPSAAGVLADHRSWEMVSPVEKHGATVEPISREGALIQASVAGSSLTWTATSPVQGDAQGDRRPEPVQVVSSRGSTGWSSSDITTPHDRGEGVDPGEATEYRFFSPELGVALVQPEVPTETHEDPPLAPGATEKTLYRRDQATGVFEPIVTPEDDTASPTIPFGGALEFEGATSDLQHVVFGSDVPLLAGGGERGLYEWESGGALDLVSRLPGTLGTPAAEPALGYDGRDVRNAISDRGSRIFWSNGGEEGPLYMRDTQTGETIQVNAAQGEGTTEPTEEDIDEGAQEVYFQAASDSGSKVFFTDTWPLTPDSTLEPSANEAVVEEAGKLRNAGRPADLYEYDVETGELHDITADDTVGESADVLGTVPGVSEDGSDVYFVANGVLAPGAEPGDCPRNKPLVAQPEDECNLYVSEPDAASPEERVTKLIARLSDEDAGDWGNANSPLPGDLGGVTAEVSSNGRYFAFMSDRELTGYDNVDANPAAGGAHDEEVYLYDNQNGRLVCASCDPTGEPPHGVFDTANAGEGLGLVVDRPRTWEGQWLAGSLPGWTLFELNDPRADHQPRYLSNTGRLFFNGADALLAQVTAKERQEAVNGSPVGVGVENVYEYEPGGEGSCQDAPGCISLVSSGTSNRESAFLDASESGDDVFFLTAAQLLAQDTDESLDVYDASVCGTAETHECLPLFVPPPRPCVGEECRGPSGPSLEVSSPASSTYFGPGNVGKTEVLGNKTSKPPARKLTRKQLLAKALKACKRYKRKHKRVPCERLARKRYGPPAKTKRPKGKR
jgi:hypothetical protein